ncbi:MAG: peroxidase family protein, partial [Anaeromyxobacteraceae bacterium]
MLLVRRLLLLALYPLTSAHAQIGPVGNGFSIDAGDVRFIFHQIEVGQFHAGGGALLGPGPNQVNLNGVPDPQLPVGLRTVDGTFNNLVPIPDQHRFGSADRLFPRLTTPTFGPAVAGTSYATKTDTAVIDSRPRVISNLIVDQSATNPAAVAAAANPCGSGGFVCSGSTAPDPDSGALFIPNITPDFGLSAPFNLMFPFFGQFFDHGLDLVTKGGSGTVIMPLNPDDPLFVPGSKTNFMAMTRGQNQPGPDGILGTADDIQETMNTTTPWVDQNQTYTSHPAHQVFLRQYVLDAQGRPVPDGKVLDGGHCAPRGTGIPGDEICNIGSWADVKAQAASTLGIRLTDQDVFDVPLIVTDPYGHFKPGPRGFPQLVRPGNVRVEGDPAANGGAGLDIPADALRTGHAFLNDIAHNASPNPGLTAARDGVYCYFRDPSCTTAPGTYDGDVLDAHFVTGDGRGNENIALTMVHNLFHAEHNRLVHQFDRLVHQLLTPAEIARWKAVDPASGWGYGERLFQAARFVTEMQYQHLVFEEFARKIQPLVNPFLGGITSIDAAISAEFAHTVYRLGHSMLPERVGRTNTDGSTNDARLLDIFLNPSAYNDGGPAGTLTAAAAAGAIIRGTVRQVGNELDEFVTSSVRNTLVGQPLDLPAINIARGRSEGIPPLNVARRQFFATTADSALRPYASWLQFKLGLRHPESFVNFIAAYATHPSVTGATTVADKRAAAAALIAANDPILSAPSTTSGL